MSRWELVDTAVIRGDGAELRLYRRHGEYSIRIAGRGDLMSSRTHGSEDALGELACRRFANRSGVSLLVGGLGMGFTLSAALAQLGPDASVVVAELVPEVVRWNEGELGQCAGFPLRDVRVQVRETDVGALLRRACDAYDAIVLDVDNGPEGLTRRGNDDLYALSGLADAYRALKAHGTLAVWSASPDSGFTGRLRKVGFAVDERRVRAHGRKGSRHLIWLAERGA